MKQGSAAGLGDGHDAPGRGYRVAAGGGGEAGIALLDQAAERCGMRRDRSPEPNGKK
jgi:hypothetical protein